MSHFFVRLQLIPKGLWGPHDDPLLDILPFVEDALEIERRLSKQVNLANERMRYQLCVRRIYEVAARLNPQEDFVLGPNYLVLLMELEKNDPHFFHRYRMASGFYPPDIVREHYDGLKIIYNNNSLGIEKHEEFRKRMRFFETALQKGAGVVESLGFLHPSGTVAHSLLFPPEAVKTDPSITRKPHVTKEKDKSFGVRSLFDRFRADIARSIKTGMPVNFSNMPHSIIAEVLHSFVYKEEPDQQPVSIRVVYMDGSEAEPFPLRCLLPAKEGPNMPDEVQILKVSLVSMRHLEMDEHVDMAWFRNRHVSLPQSFAKTDSYCTTMTERLLKGMGDSPLHIYLYQTGLETAVTGFYRGLVNFLIRQKEIGSRRRLWVTPFYFDNAMGEYKPGKVWS